MNKAVVKVTGEMVGLTDTIVDSDGQFTKITCNLDMAFGTFERCGSRYELSLIRITADRYIVAIPNFYFCIETKFPNSIQYKLTEQKISNVDAESIEMGIRFLKMIFEA